MALAYLTFRSSIDGGTAFEVIFGCVILRGLFCAGVMFPDVSPLVRFSFPIAGVFF